MRPDPIAALAEAWGRELASVTPDGVRIADYGVRNLRAEEESWCRAESKRARRAAKRAEDERRTAEGRASYTPPEKLGFERSGWFTGWSVRLAQWDGAPYEMEWPRWRIRSRERRALPGMERPWHCSPKQMLHALSKLFNGRPSRYIVMENAHHAWRSAL